MQQRKERYFVGFAFRLIGACRKLGRQMTSRPSPMQASTINQPTAVLPPPV